MSVEDIDVVTVLGAGNMGHGIAELAAIAGYEVRMRDIEQEFVDRGYENVEWSLNKLAEKGQLTEDEAEAALDRITPLVDLAAAVDEADVVIEAVPERLDVKRSVYEELTRVAPEDAIFATNTSSLSITDLAGFTDRPERFCGMHFFNPPVRMALVEVITGDRTAEETLETVEALAEAMGKTPVRVHKDSPGFVVNRVLIPLLNESAWMLHEGEATMAEIDSSTKYRMGLPMGAFELTDQVGIDVGYDVLDYLHAELGDAYAPCPLLEEKLDAGDLGKKTGRGFYDYEDGGAEIPADAGREDVVERLTAMMANEVAHLVGEGVAEPPAIDEAMRLGAAFPDGPAKMADDLGLDVCYETLVDRREATGAARYEPAAELERRAEAGESFYPTPESDAARTYEHVRVERPGDGVGHLVLDRPHRLNTITVEMLDEIEAAIDEFEADESVRAVLLTGAGEKAFCAGADITSVAGSVAPLDAVEFSRKGQRVFGRLERSDLPVVAGIDGYALGGGMELATCADLRVASERSELGQPEHNLGIMPGWGGTQRLGKIVGEGRAKELIFTAERFDAATCESYGFVNRVVPDGDLLDAAMDLARDLAAGPPVAQRYTKRAMLAGRDDTEAGLEYEAQAFGLLLGTDDAMEGAAALMADREPEFEGH